MAGEQVDHLAVAREAARLDDVAVRCSRDGRRVEALAAAEEAARLYGGLAEDFPVMFGPDAERAAALATAIREGRPAPSTAAPRAARPVEPAPPTGPPDGPAPADAPAPDNPASDNPASNSPAPDSPTSGTAPPDTPVPDTAPPGTPDVPDDPEADPAHERNTPAPAAPPARRPGRSRRRTVVSTTAVAVAVVVVLGAVGAAGWTLSRPPAPAPAPAPVPAPPAAAPVEPWTATARADVAPTGVTLRSAPSTTAPPAGRLPVGGQVDIRCGEIGRMTSSETGERSAGWLRTTTGSYLAAVNVEFRGPSPVPNCVPGRPPVPVPHRR